MIFFVQSMISVNHVAKKLKNYDNFWILKIIHVSIIFGHFRKKLPKLLFWPHTFFSWNLNPKFFLFGVLTTNSVILQIFFEFWKNHFSSHF